jgi:hypothetical protein
MHNLSPTTFQTAKLRTHDAHHLPSVQQQDDTNTSRVSGGSPRYYQQEEDNHMGPTLLGGLLATRPRVHDKDGAMPFFCLSHNITHLPPNGTFYPCRILLGWPILLQFSHC